ncbi:hypothetical protein [Rhizobium sp. 2MFCol3.1]|uniref:hypothetical protein n=1 Tax=Rhizobium sp. 2MFCol3.1 TaxID=1246459 RepID=UPI000370B497|nr:hypothetical protein [Rhizobium sp. 2MFCol3.1]
MIKNSLAGKNEVDNEPHPLGIELDRSGSAGTQSDLPENIRAIQELFRPRFEAQDRRMEALFAAHAAAEAAAAELSHGVPVHEALEMLERLESGHSIFASESLDALDEADERMEALAATEFAARLRNAKVTHDLPVDEALELLEQVANGEIDWPV